MLLETVISFLSAIAIGSLIGIERELVSIDKKKEINMITGFGGVRTFMLLSLLGATVVYFSKETNNWNIFLIAGIMSLLIIFANYIYNLFIIKESGATTEVAGIITFFLGGLCTAGYANIAVIVGILTTGILLSKRYLGTVLEHTERKELYSTLTFAIILFIVLPILPNQTLDPWEIVNPQKIWYVVVLISAISYIGYIASKIFGATKGVIISGIFGGLASSTAVSSAMSMHSKKNTSIITPLVIATLVASSMMFIRVFVLVYSFNPTLAPSLFIPVLVMTLTSASIIGIFTYTSTRKDKTLTKAGQTIPLESPFQVLPALKFALFFLVVSALSQFAAHWFGANGTYVISFISGFADVDAISISLSTQALLGQIAVFVATKGLIIAMMTNTVVKIIIAYLFGSREYFKSIAMSFGVIMILGIASLFFI